MFEAHDFQQRQLRKHELRTTAHRTHGHLFGNGSVTPSEESIVEGLPVNTLYQTSLRNRTTGARLYPADLAPAGSHPAQ